MEDLLIVSFDKNDRDNEAGLCIARKHPNGDTTVLKMAFDEQARILYRLLTDQSAKAKVMAKNDEWMYMIFDKNMIKAKTEQWTKEAEKAGMTLTEYLKSISPLAESKVKNDT